MVLNKRVFKVFIMISLIAFPIFAGDDDGLKVIDDGDKTSSQFSDMYDDIETVENAVNAAKGTVQAVKTTKSYIKERKKGKFNPIEKAKGKFKEMVFKYKSTKAGFLKLLYDFSRGVSKVLQKVDKRINMWRTTLPTLKSYAKTSKLLVNNTVEVFREFRVKDLWDIDRAWSRKMEAYLYKTYRCFFSFGRYMTKRYYLVNEEDIKANCNKKYDFFMYGEDDLQQGICYNEVVLSSNMYVLFNMHKFNNLPKTTLMNAAQALHCTEGILRKSYDLNFMGVPFQQAMYDSIALALECDKKTYVDEQQLGAYIAQKRAEIEIQRTELEQILTSMTIQYSRLLLREKERGALASDSYDGELKRLSGGGNFKNYQEHRKEIFGNL